MGHQHRIPALEQSDPLIASALTSERQRQREQIEMIASENTVSAAVLEALGSEITNKTVEGYPGRRFHGGADFVDVVEQAAIDRAKALFDCAYANVQPHSGSQANQAVLFALLQPGDRMLSMDLAAGGHLSHGAVANQSGRIYRTCHYAVDRQTGRIDYRKVDRTAREMRPKLLIAGGSAYPRQIDFERLRAIADGVDALFMVDMAHFAGLVAAGVHPSPVPSADVVTLTTTKTMRGPRGGVILSNRQDLFSKLQSAVFPGVQGSLHPQVIAAKAVCFREAMTPEFKHYGKKVRDNARALAGALRQNGVPIVSGGTDTHLVLLDLSTTGVTGQQAQDMLEKSGITANKNPIPFDAPNPSQWVGLRLGTSAGTTRGFEEAQFEMIGRWIADLLAASLNGRVISSPCIEETHRKVVALCRQFPLY
jgi:glycine hydroxymethyltransferase